MCILIAKNKNVRKMTTDEIKNSSENNPDGFGMAWVERGKIKSLHTFDVKDIIKKNNELPDNAPIIYHFRIATHGSVKLNNCHPFISHNKDVAFGHNGILSIENEADMTDSETAFIRLFYPVIKCYGIKNKALDYAVNTIIGTSKFAFLFQDGSIKTYGNFINEDGLLFSNSSYVYNDYLPTYIYGGDYYKKRKSINVPPMPFETTQQDDEFESGYYEQYFKAEDKMEALLWNNKNNISSYEFLSNFIEKYSYYFPLLEWSDFEDMYCELQKL
jgi:predicted glutamine amidotransferase